jgi:hypothetical protein
MPGQVVKVRRRERLTWAGRLYLPMIFLGLWITGRHFVRNLWGYMIGRKKTFVVQYPEEQLDYTPASSATRRSSTSTSPGACSAGSVRRPVPRRRSS